MTLVVHDALLTRPSLLLMQALEGQSSLHDLDWQPSLLSVLF